MKSKKDNSLLSYYGFTKVDQKKNPVITRILKQLTPERIEKEIKEIQAIELPPELQKWVKEYEKVGERDEFIWKWMYEMFRRVSFPVFFGKYQDSLEKSKFLITMFVVLLDDAAEKKYSKNLLDELLKIPLGQDYIKFNQLNKKEKEYLKFTIKIWNYIRECIKKYPRYKELEDVFNYDINQVLNAILYSFLVNKNFYLMNKIEYWLYLPHNMAFMVYFTIDLMCSPKFIFKKIGVLREMFWEIQKMGRADNWMLTWEREIKDKDFTSGIFAYLIEKGIFTREELQKENKDKIIKKIKESDIEHSLLIKWEDFYNDVEKLGKKIKSPDVKKLLKELEYLLTVDLATQGYK